jgi:hypothetical protein
VDLYIHSPIRLYDVVLNYVVKNRDNFNFFTFTRLRFFENRVLRKMFGHKGEEVTGGWRKLHNEELYNLYLPDFVGVIKPRIMRLAGHVARMGAKIILYKI